MNTCHGLNLHICCRQESLDRLLAASDPVFVQGALPESTDPVELHQGSLEISGGVEGGAQRFFSSHWDDLVIMRGKFFSEENLIFKKIYNEGKLEENVIKAERLLKWNDIFYTWKGFSLNS